MFLNIICTQNVQNKLKVGTAWTVMNVIAAFIGFVGAQDKQLYLRTRPFAMLGH